MFLRNKIAYVAGPYRAETEYGVKCNINRAEKVAGFLWQEGYPTICPHKNTAFFGGLTGNDNDWLEGDLIILARCDFVVLVEGWENSSGTKAEIKFAEMHGIPVYESIDDFLTNYKHVDDYR